MCDQHSRTHPPGTGYFSVHLVARNLGPAGCTFRGMGLKFSTDMPTRDAVQAPPEQTETHSTATILLPGNDFSSPGTWRSRSDTDGQYCFGYLRWEDAMGKWRYYFCV